MKLTQRVTDFLFSFFINKYGRYSRNVFFASSKVFGESCLELCVFRKNGRSIEILLIPRPDTDPFWAGLLHIPGIRKLPSDTDSVQLERVCGELDFSVDVSKIKYAASTTVKNERGTEFSDVRYVCVPYSQGEENFFDVSHLPENIIPFQKKLIQLGLEAFLNDK